ncbi:hypothetical protein J2T11_001328 [Paenarthrobacter nicotinovorans]|jgi:hypothetical protein|uniref:hypothetical protein n=1 Tax=Paenarthrobacter nicotinovorans TaxID=29320 RepID=UPI0027828CB0|nr:hypothetical protein [Paenarthrobacter nicotinovorans]MDP9934988.1 hypothetical protein [Paenarthrobacter nicotinovorans]
MSFPLFHDPLQGNVTVDVQPVRDPQIHCPSRAATQAPRSSTHGTRTPRSARQREVAKVADDLRALMARTTLNGTPR